MKERLTGAIILVALIVLLVPELLTGPIRPAPAVAANSSEEPPLRTYTIHLAEDGQSQAHGADPGPAMPQPSVPPQSSSAAAAQSGASPGSAAEATSAPGPTSSSMNSATPPSPNPTPAAKGSAAASAPDSSTSTAESAQGGRTIRPDATRAHSHRTTGGSAAKQAASAIAANRVAAGGGWMVQLGVFASRENAQRLAQDMKDKGFKAAVSDVTTGTHHLFRVRVGPAADRAAAQDLQARLRAAGRAGTVVPVS